MPRGAKKTTAHQHNSRHENGIVAPGKRVARQKSNSHLNETVDGTYQSSTPPSPSLSSHPPAQMLDSSTTVIPATWKNGTQVEKAAVGAGQRAPEDMSEDSEPPAVITTYANGSLENYHRKIDINAAKNPKVHDNNIFNLALTILRSCPLGDTIAILIFLLSLPPTLLTLTNALFAVLTFMPPAGSFSLPTTLNDVFQGSGGTPSLATVVLTDIIGLVVWLVIWTPLQVLGLELAQAVVATTLGGGSSNKNGSSDSTLFCMLIVLVTHIVRHKWVPKRIMGFDWSTKMSLISHIPRGLPSFSGDDFITTRSPASWFRILVALHVVVQGLVHVARRWYTKREYSQAVSLKKKSDPEAVAGSQAPPEIASTAEQTSLLSRTSSELVTKLSLSNLKEPRDKVSSGKKKRKQGTYVRSQQPLWAAFAATKVTVLREMDQSHALSEALGSNATDTKNLGSAPFVSEEGRIWITWVQPTSFSFDASYFSAKESEVVVSAGINRSKPFYVRLNGADWTSTKIEKSVTAKITGESADQWTGEVFGLSPSSSYKCSFVRSEDGVVLHSAIISTPSLPADETENLVSSTPPTHSLRPSSPTTPTTTLKKSIAALDASLSESQARQKRTKKENKATSVALRKEVDILQAKISKIAGEDKAHLNRHLQWNQHFRQADDAIASISSEIDAMGSIPEGDSKQWKATKSNWEQARDQQSRSREELFRCKESAYQDKSSIQSEATATQQKRERLQARSAKLNEQRERLQSATVQGLDERERKESEQAAKAMERQQVKEKTTEQIAAFYRSLQEVRYQSQQSWQQARIVENAFHQQQMIGMSSETEPVNPEGELQGTNRLSSCTSGYRFPPMGSPDLIRHTSLRYEARPRSTSMLSSNSHYTDFSDQDPAPPMPFRTIPVIDRQQSGSSGSSDRGSGGSQRDPTSPLASTGVRISSLGKKGSPVWN